MTPQKDIPHLIDRADVLRLIGRGCVLTLLVNMTSLVSPLFFTQVYDRVLTTGSVATLLVIAGAALLIIGLGAAFDQVRSVVFTRLGTSVYVDLEPHVFRASLHAALGGGQGRRSAALDDLESVRTGLSGPLPGAALDALFAPFFVLVLYLMHPWLGHFALALLVLMGIVSFLTQWAISSGQQVSAEASRAAASLAESHLRSSEAAAAMGYAARAQTRWASENRQAVSAQIRSAARAGGLTATARGLRQSGQILMISLAAFLTLGNAVSGGAIIAASILLGRVLQPLDILIGSWRQVSHAVIASKRLRGVLTKTKAGPPVLAPRPAGRLSVDNLFASTGKGSPILRGVSFALEPGEIVAVIGPTGAGKSTLLRCVLGVWPWMTGMVRLDGAPITAETHERIGQWLGFLPQNADLAPGTIAENISRFGDADPEAIQAAARAAGAETLIASLPMAYDTDVGEGGSDLSAGQRRRIALARAMFGQPSLICLDEPEAHLDRNGEIALVHALQQSKAAGASVLIAAHRPAIVAQADKVLVLKDGRIAEFGDTSEIMPKLTARAAGQG